MKIAFLCGCLEFGCDGVGDYVRRLAGELAAQGHQTAGIALNDEYVTQEVLAVEAGFTLLRLPAAWPSSRRVAHIKQWVAIFDPEWLSLQFVPFSFHPKGLPFGLGKQLEQVGHGRMWHLMMHELWVGMQHEAPTKHVWWGKVQRYLIKALIARLQPKVVHTQTRLYQAQLAKLRVESQLLPLFANIARADSQAQAGPELPQALHTQAQATIKLLMFGSIHPGAPVAAFVHDVAQYAAQATPVVLTLVGRCGPEQAHWVAAWEGAGLPVELLGEQTPQRISEALASASLGIATTPLAQIEKSGTTAAMLEHGLPVLCVARPWSPRGLGPLEVPAGIVAYVPGNFEAYLPAKASMPAPATAHQIARQLASTLEVVA